MKLNTKTALVGLVSVLALGSGCAVVQAGRPQQAAKIEGGANRSGEKQLAATTKPTQKQLQEQLNSYTPAQLARIKAMNDQFQELEKAGRQDMENGRYGAALAAFSQQREIYKAGGYSLDPYHPGEIECNFKLGDYAAVLKLADKFGTQSAGEAGAVGICLIKRGDFASAKKLYKPEQMITRYTQDYDVSKFVPRPDSPKSLECGFYLARGIGKFFFADFAHAKEELEDANAILPNQPLVAYYLGSSLSRLGDTAEAAKFAPYAAKMGGPYVQRAQLMSQPINTYKGKP